MPWPGLERREVLEVLANQQRDLSADVGNLQFRHEQTEMLDRADSARGSIADEPGRLVVPLAVQKVDRILQRGGRPMVVLRSDEDESVEGLDLLAPTLRML